MAVAAVQLLDGRRLEEREKDTLLALQSSAVVYYTRSTKTRSKHRRTFDIRPYLDERETETHDLFCRLRDDAIAHFGPGELAEGPALRADYLFVDRAGRLATVSRSLYGSDELARRLASHAQRVSHIMQRLFHDRENELVAALNDLVGDKQMEALARDATVSLLDAVGDEEVARRIGEGPSGREYIRIG
jgi:hypothetical protein